MKTNRYQHRDNFLHIKKLFLGLFLMVLIPSWTYSQNASETEAAIEALTYKQLTAIANANYKALVDETLKPGASFQMEMTLGSRGRHTVEGKNLAILLNKLYETAVINKSGLYVRDFQRALAAANAANSFVGGNRATISPTYESFQIQNPNPPAVIPSNPELVDNGETTPPTNSADNPTEPSTIAITPHKMPEESANLSAATSLLQSDEINFLFPQASTNNGAESIPLTAIEKKIQELQAQLASIDLSQQGGSEQLQNWRENARQEVKRLQELRKTQLETGNAQLQEQLNAIANVAFNMDALAQAPFYSKVPGATYREMIPQTEVIRDRAAAAVENHVQSRLQNTQQEIINTRGKIAAQQALLAQNVQSAEATILSSYNQKLFNHKFGAINEDFMQAYQSRMAAHAQAITQARNAVSVQNVNSLEAARQYANTLDTQNEASANALREADKALEQKHAQLKARVENFSNADSEHYIPNLSETLQDQADDLVEATGKLTRSLNDANVGGAHLPVAGFDQFLKAVQLEKALEGLKAHRLERYQSISESLNSRASSKSSPLLNEEEFTELNNLDQSIEALQKNLNSILVLGSGIYGAQIEKIQKENIEEIHSYAQNIRSKSEILSSLNNKNERIEEILNGKNNAEGALEEEGLNQLYEERRALLAEIESSNKDNLHGHMRIPSDTLQWNPGQKADFIRGNRVRPQMDYGNDAESALSALENVESKIEAKHQELAVETDISQEQEKNSALHALSNTENGPQELSSYQSVLQNIQEQNQNSQPQVQNYNTSLRDFSSETLEDYYQVSAAQIMFKKLLEQRQAAVQQVFELKNLALGKKAEDIPNLSFNKEHAERVEGAFDELSYYEINELEEELKALLEGNENRKADISPEHSKGLALREDLSELVSNIVEYDKRIEALSKALGNKGPSDLVQVDYAQNALFNENRTSTLIQQARGLSQSVQSFSGVNGENADAHSPELLVDAITLSAKNRNLENSLRENNSQLTALDSHRSELHEINQDKLAQFREIMENKGKYQDGIDELNQIQEHLNVDRVLAQRASLARGSTNFTRLDEFAKHTHQFRNIAAWRIEEQWLKDKIVELKEKGAPTSEISDAETRLEEVTEVVNGESPYPVRINKSSLTGDERPLDPYTFAATALNLLKSENRYFRLGEEGKNEGRASSLAFELERLKKQQEELLSPEELKAKFEDQQRRIAQGEKIEDETPLSARDVEHKSHLYSQKESEIAQLEKLINDNGGIRSIASKTRQSNLEALIEDDFERNTLVLGEEKAQELRAQKQEKIDTYFEQLRNAYQSWDDFEAYKNTLRGLKEKNAALIKVLATEGNYGPDHRENFIHDLQDDEDKLDDEINSQIRELNEIVKLNGLDRAPHNMTLLEELKHPGSAPMYHINQLWGGTNDRTTFFNNWTKSINDKVQELRDFQSAIEAKIADFKGDTREEEVAYQMVAPLENLHQFAMEEGWISGDPRNANTRDLDDIIEEMASNQEKLEKLKEQLAEANSQLTEQDNELTHLLEAQHSIEMLEAKGHEAEQESGTRAATTSEVLRNLHQEIGQRHRARSPGLFDASAQAALQRNIAAINPKAALNPELSTVALENEAFSASQEIAQNLRPTFEEGHLENADTVQEQSEKLKDRVALEESMWEGSGRDESVRLHPDQNEGIESRGRYAPLNTQNNSCDVQKLQADVLGHYLYQRYFETVVMQHQQPIVDATAINLRPMLMKLEAEKQALQELNKKSPKSAADLAQITSGKQKISLLVQDIKKEWEKIQEELSKLEESTTNILAQVDASKPTHILYADAARRRALASATSQKINLHLRTITPEQHEKIELMASNVTQFKELGDRALAGIDEIETKLANNDLDWKNPLSTLDGTAQNASFDDHIKDLNNDFTQALLDKRSLARSVDDDYPHWLPGEVARRHRNTFREGDTYANSSEAARELQRADSARNRARQGQLNYLRKQLPKYKEKLETWIMLENFKQMRAQADQWGLELAQHNSETQQALQAAERLVQNLEEFKTQRFNEIFEEQVQQEVQNRKAAQIEAARQAHEAQNEANQKAYEERLKEQQAAQEEARALAAQENAVENSDTEVENDSEESVAEESPAPVTLIAQPVAIPFDESSVAFNTAEVADFVKNDPATYNLVHARTTQLLIGNPEEGLAPDPQLLKKKDDIAQQIHNIPELGTLEKFDISSLPMADLLGANKIPAQAAHSVYSIYAPQNLQNQNAQFNAQLLHKELFQQMNEEDPNRPGQLISRPQQLIDSLSADFSQQLALDSMISARGMDVPLLNDSHKLKEQQLLQLNHAAENIRQALLVRLPEEESVPLNAFALDLSYADLQETHNGGNPLQERLENLDAIQRYLEEDFREMVQNSQKYYDHVSTKDKEYSRALVGNDPFQNFYPDSRKDGELSSEDPLQRIKLQHPRCSHDLIYRTACHAKINHALMVYDGVYDTPEKQGELELGEEKDEGLYKWLSAQSRELHDKFSELKESAPSERAELVSFVEAKLQEWDQEGSSFYSIAGRSCQEWKEILYREELVVETDTHEELYNRAKRFDSHTAANAVNDLHTAPAQDLTGSSFRSFYNTFKGGLKVGEFKENGKLSHVDTAIKDLVSFFDRVEKAKDGKIPMTAELEPFARFIERHPDWRPRRGYQDTVFRFDDNGRLTENVFSAFYEDQARRCSTSAFLTYDSDDDQTTEYTDCLDKARADLDHLVMKSFGGGTKGMDRYLKGMQAAVEGSIGLCSRVMGRELTRKDILNPFAADSLLYNMKSSGAKVLIIPATDNRLRNPQDKAAQMAYYGTSTAVQRSLNTETTNYASSKILYGDADNSPVPLTMDNRSIDVADASLFVGHENKTFQLGEGGEDCNMSVEEILNTRNCQRICRDKVIVLRYSPPYDEWHVGRWDDNRDEDLTRETLENFLNLEAVKAHHQASLGLIRELDGDMEKIALVENSQGLPLAPAYKQIDESDYASEGPVITSYDHQKLASQMREEEAARQRAEAARKQQDQNQASQSSAQRVPTARAVPSNNSRTRPSRNRDDKPGTALGRWFKRNFGRNND